MRWWQWIGPWPLRPLALGFLTGIFALATTSYLLTLPTAPRIIGSAVAAGSVAGAVFWLCRRFAPRAVTHLPGYIASVVLASFASNVVRFATDTALDFRNFTPAANFIFTWGRSIVFGLVILALLGASQRRLLSRSAAPAHRRPAARPPSRMRRAAAKAAGRAPTPRAGTGACRAGRSRPVG